MGHHRGASPPEGRWLQVVLHPKLQRRQGLFNQRKGLWSRRRCFEVKELRFRGLNRDTRELPRAEGPCTHNVGEVCFGTYDVPTAPCPKHWNGLQDVSNLGSRRPLHGAQLQSK